MSNLLIQIYRQSDNTKFEAGTGLDWQVEDEGLSGFGSFQSDLGFVDSANRDGGDITSEHIGKKDRTITFIYRPSLGHDLARRNVLAFGARGAETYNYILICKPLLVQHG